VYFNQGPILKVSLAGALGEFQEAPTDIERTSGRGSPDDPDVPQARAFREDAPDNTPSSNEPWRDVSPRIHDFFGAFLPPASLAPRIVLRFADLQRLRVSGLLAGGSEMANSPALIDVPFGRGNVVLFAFNPMWRQETEGSFMLFLNAALHYDHLGVGRESREN
jgi:hypothetical protein